MSHFFAYLSGKENVTQLRGCSFYTSKQRADWKAGKGDGFVNGRGLFLLKNFFLLPSGACLTPRDSQHTCDSDSLCGCFWKWGICSPGHWNTAKFHCCRDDKICISSCAIPFSRRIGLGLYVQHTHSPAAWGFILYFPSKGTVGDTTCSGGSDSVPSFQQTLSE